MMTFQTWYSEARVAAAAPRSRAKRRHLSPLGPRGVLRTLRARFSRDTVDISGPMSYSSAQPR